MTRIPDFLRPRHSRGGVPAALLPLALALTLTHGGCRATPASAPASAPSDGRPRDAAQSTPSAPPPPTFRPDQPLALLDGRSLTFAQLGPPLLEAAGGETLSEIVLDLQIRTRLEQRGQAIGQTQIDAERKLMALALDADPDRAQKLLRELRDRRGLGERRFDLLLTRNAGLRMLVQDQVEVTESALRQAFDYQYGPRYEVRLVTVDALPTAAEVIAKAKAGTPFSDLAVAYSTDESKAQGGLLSPMSLADPSYPQAVRSALSKLQQGQVSDPIALDRGFAVIRLEKKTAGKEGKFEEVKGSLQDGVRRQVERMQMERLAKTILREADLVVLEPALQKSWLRQKRALAGQDR